jgi:hypothetical protein
MTVTEFARAGGKARAKKLSARRRAEIAASGAEAAKLAGKQTGRPNVQRVKRGCHGTTRAKTF